MLAQYIVSSLLFVAGAMAQNSGTQSATPTNPSDMAGPDGKMVSVQVVRVSDMNSTLKYFPEEIEAQPGSMVQFQFYPKVRSGLTLLGVEWTDAE
jgi:plastocyanin